MQCHERPIDGICSYICDKNCVEFTDMQKNVTDNKKWENIRETYSASFDIGLFTEFASTLHNTIKMLELVCGYIIPGINLFRPEASFPDIVYMGLGHG